MTESGRSESAWSVSACCVCASCASCACGARLIAIESAPQLDGATATWSESEVSAIGSGRESETECESEGNGSAIFGGGHAGSETVGGSFGHEVRVKASVRCGVDAARGHSIDSGDEGDGSEQVTATAKRDYAKVSG